MFLHRGAREIAVKVVNNNPLLSKELKKDFHSYYRRMFNISEIYNDVDSALADVKNENYCIVLYCGILFHRKEELFSNVKKFIESVTDNWLVIGHIIDQTQSEIFWKKIDNVYPSKWYYLWPILQIVNCRTWKYLNNPVYNKSIDNVNIELPAVERSIENIHDTYTPLHIKKNGSETVIIQNDFLKNGWNYLKESLENNLTVYNVPEDIRNLYTYTYPDNDIELYNQTFKIWRNFIQDEFTDLLIRTDTNNLYKDKHNDLKINKIVKRIKKLSPKTSKLHDRLIERLAECHARTFSVQGLTHFNSETITVDPTLKLLIKDIDTFIAPCQGLKDFTFAYNRYYEQRENLTFIHYDLTNNILKEKKNFIKNWNGKINDSNFTLDQKIAQESIESSFSSHEELLEKWKIYQKQKHFFVCQNLFLEEKEGRIKKCLQGNKSKNVFFLYSDIFQWQSNLILYGHDILQKIKDDTLMYISKDLDLFIAEGKALDGDKIEMWNL